MGHLYRSVEQGLAHLADVLGEDRLFIGPAFQQADESAFGWPDLSPITDLAGANRALERIVEQGEGATGDWATAHYGRFLGMLDEYLAMRDGGSGLRTRSPGRRRRAESGGGDRTGRLHHRPHHRRLLRPLQRRVRAAAADDRALLRVRPRDTRAATDPGRRRRRPHVPGHQAARPPARRSAGRTRASRTPPREPTSSCPYRASFLLPHHRAAWLRFAERLDELAGYAAGLHPPAGKTCCRRCRARWPGRPRTCMEHVEPV